MHLHILFYVNRNSSNRIERKNRERARVRKKANVLQQKHNKQINLGRYKYRYSRLSA